MKTNSPENILIVAHDSGGAAILSSWICRHPENYYEFCLEGPAIKFFEQRRPGVSVSDRKILYDLKAFDRVITGTGWESDLEKKAIQSANDQGIPSVAFIDHWTNYIERFQFEGAVVLPEEIWVGDEYALQKAKEVFKDVAIRLQPNPYWMDIVDSINELSKTNPSKKSDGKFRILYVTEPTALAAKKATGDAYGFGYTEFEALEKYLELIISSKVAAEVRLRPHPREAKGKYAGVVQKFRDQILITVSEEIDLAKDCAWCDWVVGCDSMAMAIGVLAKKEVFCAIPSKGKPGALPFQEIQYVFR